MAGRMGSIRAGVDRLEKRADAVAPRETRAQLDADWDRSERDLHIAYGDGTPYEAEPCPYASRAEWHADNLVLIAEVYGDALEEQPS